MGPQQGFTLQPQHQGSFGNTQRQQLRSFTMPQQGFTLQPQHQGFFGNTQRQQQQRSSGNTQRQQQGSGTPQTKPWVPDFHFGGPAPTTGAEEPQLFPELQD